jgi:pimeloyl-ACP methyl ester carboxylesterase
MRPIETLLSLDNLLAFIVLVFHSSRWTGYAVVMALLIAGAQVLVEGPRWQMVPAYALAGLFFLIWLLQKIAPGGGIAEYRWINGLTVGLGVLGLVISTALPIIFPVFRFPNPTGPYAIGTVTYHWVDADRPEVFTADPDDRRELVVQIWYPAKADSSSPRAPYISDARAVTQSLAPFLRLPKFIFGHLKYVSTHAVQSAPMAEDQPSYPVLIFLEGLAGYRQQNTFQVEELVSHGYIVAAIDQPYAAAMVVFPDGRQAAYDRRFDPPYFRAGYDPSKDPAHNPFLDDHLPYLTQDVVFTLDQLTALNQADPMGILTGRLDLQRAGLFGHSFGGIVGGEACLLEPRLRACLLEDAFMPADVVRAGLRQPAMWITRDADTMRLERRRSGGWPEPAIEEHITTMRAVYESLLGEGYYVQVPGIFHIDMTDSPMRSPIASVLGISGPIGVERAHEIVNAYSVAFFDRELKGQPATRFDDLIEQYPEALLETHRP